MNARQRLRLAQLSLGVVLALVAWHAAGGWWAEIRSGHHGISCLSNAKQLTLACLQYAEDYDGRLPGYAMDGGEQAPVTPWPTALLPYTKHLMLLTCPQAQHPPAPLARRAESHPALLQGWSMANPVQPGEGVTCHYLINRELAPLGGGLPVSAVREPARTLLLADGTAIGGDGSAAGRQRVLDAARHGGRLLTGVNVAFADGRVSHRPCVTFGQVRYEP